MLQWRSHRGPMSQLRCMRLGSMGKIVLKKPLGASIFSYITWGTWSHQKASYYTEYKLEEKKGRNAKGADDYQLCTDRKNDCSCEFYEGQELKDCQKNLLEHCSKGACQQWMHMNKCTHTETDTTMKLMHKNSNMRIGTCFDKKQLKTRMMMAQCPEGYEKCDCNHQC